MNDPRPRLLIVNAESAHLRTLCDTLEGEGYVTRGFASAKEALATIDPDVTVIVMTGSGTIDTAVKAMRMQGLQRENAQLLQRERQRSEELAAANQALESFSHSVSHDLRAPLRSIDSLVQIMGEDYGEKLGEDGRNILTVIQEGCARLDQLITGLLAFSRSTRQPLDLMPIDMTALARAALSEVLPSYAGPEPTVEIAPLPPAMGDVTLIRQVWCNLLDNALKFSARKPSPRVQVTGRTESGQTHYRVEDNGSGFDMKYAHKLFGVFHRLHKATDYSGTGVGLAIVQRIITRHGGQVAAHARPDVGATFEFSLPIIDITD